VSGGAETFLREPALPASAVARSSSSRLRFSMAALRALRCCRSTEGGWPQSARQPRECQRTCVSVARGVKAVLQMVRRMRQTAHVNFSVSIAPPPDVSQPSLGLNLCERSPGLWLYCCPQSHSTNM
jgi:hypothetical protein